MAIALAWNHRQTGALYEYGEQADGSFPSPTLRGERDSGPATANANTNTSKSRTLIGAALAEARARARNALPFRSVNRAGMPGYDPGVQRHHLLPRQLLGHRCFGPLFDLLGRDRLGFEDFRTNGLLLPASDSAVCAWACRCIAGRIGITTNW
jgi:hypothetical protein